MDLRVTLRQTWGTIVLTTSVSAVVMYYASALFNGARFGFDAKVHFGDVGVFGTVLGGVVLVAGWLLLMLLDLDAWDQRELHTWIDSTVRGWWRGEVELGRVFGGLQWVCEDMADGVWEVWVKQYSKGEREMGEGGDVRM